MEYSFREWLTCPECSEDEEIGILKHNSEIVFECYECGQISEFTLGDERPFDDH